MVVVSVTGLHLATISEKGILKKTTNRGKCLYLVLLVFFKCKLGFFLRINYIWSNINVLIMDNSWHRQGRLFKWLFFTRHAYHILILVVFCFTVVLSNYVPKSSIIPLNLPYVLETFSKYPFSICVVIKQILMLNRWCVIGPL